MQDEQRVNEQFDLIRFVSNSLRLLRRTFWLVLLAAVLGALLMGVRAKRSYSPMYESHAVLSVKVDNSTVTDVIGVGDKTNSTYTRQIVATFPTIIQSDAMRERILRELGTSRINGAITPRVVADSNLFTLTVRSSSPDDAYNILNAVLKCYPDMAFVYIGAASISIIEAPVRSAVPVNAPNFTRSAVIGALGAGLLVLAILCLLAQMQTIVTSTGDLKQYTNVPCIVHVPQTVLKRRSRGGNQLSLRNEHLPPVYREAIRVLGARVLRMCREQDLKRILVTSTVPGEGKSTIAANLALSLGRSGLRVVLVDADLRTQELRSFFAVETESAGMGELLRDPDLDPAASLIPIDDTGVQLLCGGRVDRPIALLRRGRLDEVLTQLEKAADLLVIDTPPIGMLTDAAVFAQHCDGAIYVVRSGATAGSRIADGMQAVADCRTKLLGYVLNSVNAKAGSRGYGYRYSYGYGYGSRYGNYGSAYGGSGYAGSSYGHYGHYNSYNSYGSYGGYGSYENYSSASDEQKQAEQKRGAARDAKAGTEKHSAAHGSAQKKSAPTPEAQPRTPKPAPQPELKGSTAEPGDGKAERRTPDAQSKAAAPELRPLREAAADMEAAATAVREDPAYGDPELDAIVREVLATTTRDDVSRAYDLVEREAHSPRADAPHAEDKPKAHGLFHRKK